MKPNPPKIIIKIKYTRRSRPADNTESPGSFPIIPAVQPLATSAIPKPPGKILETLRKFPTVRTTTLSTNVICPENSETATTKRREQNKK